MINIVRKTTSAIFLALVLVAGTITLSYPSLMTAEAQPDADYYEMNDNYGKIYKNDNHESADYPSYEKDNYNSKDTSVSINKINCENVNNNFNNVVIGNLNIGNSGSGGGAASDDGTNGASTANAYGNNGERYNNDGYQKDKGITCIINNNNTILSGKETTTPVEECHEAKDIEACFEEFLLSDQFELLTDTLASPAGLTVEINGQDVTLRSFEDICFALEGLTTYAQVDDAVLDILEGLPGLAFPVRGDLIDCIAEVLGIEVDNMEILTPFDVNNGGTEDLTATEKVEKLKAQYVELYQ